MFFLYFAVCPKVIPKLKVGNFFQKSDSFVIHPTLRVIWTLIGGWVNLWNAKKLNPKYRFFEKKINKEMLF